MFSYLRAPRWSADRSADPPQVAYTLLGAAGIALGSGVEWAAHAGQSSVEVAADLVVGWTLLGCGLIAWSRRPQSRVGLLLTLACFGWFLGTLAGSATEPVAAVGVALLTIHRGPLMHSIVGYPSGRSANRLERVVVAAGYADAATASFFRIDLATLIVVLAVLATTIRGFLTSAGPSHRARITAVAAAAAVSVPLSAGSLGRLVGAGPRVEAPVLWGYQVALVLIAVGFLVDGLRGEWVQATVTRLVVDLGDDSRFGTLQARLAHALGDQSLLIAYWLPEVNGYVEETGRPVALPDARSGRAITMIEQQGARIAALVHDPAVLDGSGLVDAVASAARIALSNVRLRAEVRRQVVELEASRRRIIDARDGQRRRIQQRLRLGVGERLTEAQEFFDLALGAAIAREGSRAPRAAALAVISQELRDAQAELQELAAGLHPTRLTEQGLGPALSALSDRTPLPVRIVVPPQRLPAAVETAIYFACAEALTNVGKHAEASQVNLTVSSVGQMITLVVTDDGIGGADPAGSGLRGVAERIETLGGRLEVESPIGEGTRLVAQIPSGAPR
jgi:signal transduction histidine kinase